MTLRVVTIIVVSVIAVVIATTLVTMGMMPREKEDNSFVSDRSSVNLSSEKIVVTLYEPYLVDSFDSPIKEVKQHQQVQVQSEIKNGQDRGQPFAYIVQVKDSEGTVVLLSWIKSEIPAKESLKVSQSWIPSDAGSYYAETFLWDSVDRPTALSPARILTIEVKP